MFTEKNIIEVKIHASKIANLFLIDSLSRLIVVTEYFIDVVRIERGVKKGNELDGHTAAVIALENIDPAKITNFKNTEPPKLISASLDGTIRVWDPKDLTSIGLLENSGNSEISAFCYLPITNLFVTGHDTGQLKMWNIESHHCIEFD